MNKYNIEQFRIRDLREDLDETQAETARKMNLHVTTYREYENQERRVPYDFIRNAAIYFNVSADYILGLTNDKSKKW